MGIRTTTYWACVLALRSSGWLCLGVALLPCLCPRSAAASSTITSDFRLYDIASGSDRYVVVPQNYYDRLNEKGEISDPIYLRFRATFTTPPPIACTLLSAGSEDITPLVLEHLEGSLPKEINPVRDMLLFLGQDKSIRVGLQFCLPLTRQITTTDADGRNAFLAEVPSKKRNSFQRRPKPSWWTPPPAWPSRHIQVFTRKSGRPHFTNDDVLPSPSMPGNIRGIGKPR
jgi:hypothetical protein